MSIPNGSVGRSTFRAYLLGLACVVVGAWLMDVTGSVVPMAFAASAAVMWTYQLVRHLATRRRGSR